VVDNFTGYLAGFPLVKKDNTAKVLINLLENKQRQLGYYPSCICLDEGGEFVGQRLVSFLGSKHIQQLTSEPYHPEHNGRAERANHMIVESIRAAFLSSNFPKHYWHELLKSCCIMLNQVPQKDQSKSPWELMHDMLLPNSYLKPVGNPLVYLNQNPNKTQGRKFDQKGEDGKLIGFDVKLLSYCIVTSSRSVICSKHVQFLSKN
jgi:hypothetical protein